MVKSDASLDKRVSDAFATGERRYRASVVKNAREIQKLESELRRMLKKCEGRDYSIIFEYIDKHRDHPGIAPWVAALGEFSEAMADKNAEYYKVTGCRLMKKLGAKGAPLGSRGNPTLYLSPRDRLPSKDEPIEKYIRVVSSTSGNFLDKSKAVYEPAVSSSDQKKKVQECVEMVCRPRTVVCPVCGREIPVIRSTRKYCSAACRVAAHRAAVLAKKRGN